MREEEEAPRSSPGRCVSGSVSAQSNDKENKKEKKRRGFRVLHFSSDQFFPGRVVVIVGESGSRFVFSPHGSKGAPGSDHASRARAAPPFFFFFFFFYHGFSIVCESSLIQISTLSRTSLLAATTSRARHATCRVDPRGHPPPQFPVPHVSHLRMARRRDGWEIQPSRGAVLVGVRS